MKCSVKKCLLSSYPPQAGAGSGILAKQSILANHNHEHKIKNKHQSNASLDFCSCVNFQFDTLKFSCTLAGAAAIYT